MNGYQCQFCEGARPVAVLMTWLATGATVSVCEEDMSPALIHVLAIDLGVDPTKFYDAVKRFVDRAAKAEASESEKDTTGDGSAGSASADGESTTEPDLRPVSEIAAEVRDMVHGLPPGASQ